MGRGSRLALAPIAVCASLLVAVPSGPAAQGPAVPAAPASPSGDPDTKAGPGRGSGCSLDAVDHRALVDRRCRAEDGSGWDEHSDGGRALLAVSPPSLA